MKIDIVTETYEPEINGVAMTLGQLVRGLTQRGHQVRVSRASTSRQSLDPSPAACASSHQPVLMRGIPLPGYPGVTIGLPAQRRLKQLWRHDRPDVIYVATEGPLGWSAVRAARKLNIPVMSGFHTNFHAYSGHYGSRHLRVLVFRYLRWWHNQTDITLVPVESLRNELALLGFRSVAVLGRGVSTERYNPQRRRNDLRLQWGVLPDELAVIYVGRLAAEKNIGLAIRAFERIRETRPDARFILVGDGPMLKRLRESHPDFVFCGYQRSVALAEHYASADLFLFPSLTETYGNVVSEAMASGLAVVAFDYAAPQKLIQNERNGLLVQMGDEAAFITTALRAALPINTVQRVALGRAAAAAMFEYSWENEVGRFLGAAEQIILTSLQHSNHKSATDTE